MQPENAFVLVNDAIRKLADADGSGAQSWEFFCECSDTSCHARVMLTAADFDTRRAATPRVPILAAEHAVHAA